jgi:methenyltetrahydrofolate cyclohydrolase
MDRPDFPRWTIINFVEQMAEGTPMPGGGCAVAVAGALAAALGALSGQISLKKETDPAQKEVLQELQPQIDQARQEFLDLIDADALAYHEVILARRLPHKTEDEIVKRTEAISLAFARACESPGQMARLGLKVLNWAIILAQGGSPVILADVGVMGFLAVAVVHGGLINIFSNLTMMKGAPQAPVLRAGAAEMRQELEKQHREFTDLIYRRVGE